MQLYAAKRKGDLLMTTSYTWSKVLTDASGFNDNPEDPFNQRVQLWTGDVRSASRFRADLHLQRADVQSHAGFD